MKRLPIHVRIEATYPIDDVIAVLVTALESPWNWTRGWYVTRTGGDMNERVSHDQYPKADDGCDWLYCDAIAHQEFELVVRMEHLDDEDDEIVRRVPLLAFAEAWARSPWAKMDPGEIDSCDADSILQALIYGEVVFG